MAEKSKRMAPPNKGGHSFKSLGDTKNLTTWYSKAEKQNKNMECTYSWGIHPKSVWWHMIDDPDIFRNAFGLPILESEMTYALSKLKTKKRQEKTIYMQKYSSWLT